MLDVGCWLTPVSPQALAAANGYTIQSDLIRRQDFPPRTQYLPRPLPHQWALHVPLGKLHTERLVPADDDLRQIVARILVLRALAPPARLQSPRASCCRVPGTLTPYIKLCSRHWPLLLNEQRKIWPVKSDTPPCATLIRPAFDEMGMLNYYESCRV